MTLNLIPKQVIFISPHLDDVVLSCGGTINLLRRKGFHVQVATVFAASPNSTLSPLAKWMHQTWRLPYDAPSCRRDENSKALSYLGAQDICMSYKCSIYRQSKNGQHLYISKEQIFSQMWQHESKLLYTISEELQQILTSIDWMILYAPLGVGGHVDHLLVHQAVKRACVGLNRNEIVFYEDLPYALELSALQQALAHCNLSTDQYLFVPLTELDKQAKGNAIGFYASQLDVVAGNLGVSVDEIIDYMSFDNDQENISYKERIWIPNQEILDKLRHELII